MWNLIIFALIGALTGTAARVLYPGRQPMQILRTLGVGMVGSVVGGMISWIYWPEVENEFHSGNLLLSLFGAMAVIGLWAGMVYRRSLKS
jgi:uncharacterized membrane protein YeaQ/YmgE (transglycosylase-associated protein family)